MRNVIDNKGISFSLSIRTYIAILLKFGILISLVIHLFVGKQEFGIILQILMRI
jgi:hypothetical protein